MPHLEPDIMEPVVLKWIFGKPIVKLLKLPLMLVQLKDNIDVKVQNVEIMLLEIDIKVFVTKMVVTLIHLEWVKNNSSEKDLVLQLIHPKRCKSLLNLLKVHQEN